MNARKPGAIGLVEDVDAWVETFPDDFLIQHREEGGECPHCGGRIEKATVAGRSTYFCSRHQALDS